MKCRICGYEMEPIKTVGSKITRWICTNSNCGETFNMDYINRIHATGITHDEEEEDTYWIIK